MYNLLIVDDEPYIADGLNILFQEEFGENLDIYVAYNGYDVIKIMDKIRIDVFILDIKMPDINGIELHKLISKKWPNCKVIFLTAYDNFNYIKTALQNNAVDYILKTSKDEIIVDTVKKTINLLEDEKKDKKILNKINKQLKDALPQIRNDFFINLINNSVLDYEDLGNRFEYLNMKLNASSPVIILIAKIDTDQTNSGLNNQTNYIYMIKEVINEYLGSNNLLYSFVDKPNEAVCFLQPLNKMNEETKRWSDLHSFISGTLDIIQSVCKELFNASISFALSKKSYEWKDVALIYIKLSNALNYGLGFNNEILINEKYLDTKKQDSFEDFNKLSRFKNKIVNIQESLDNNNYEGYIKTIEDIISEVSNYEIYSSIGINMFFEISSKLMSYIHFFGLWSDLEKQLNIENFTNVNKYKSWDDVKNFFKKAGSLTIEQKFKKNTEEEKNIVSDVNEFINENLDNDISLAAISEHVHFNSFYLSRLYKKQAGKSISEYIAAIRIYTAKKLLRRKDIKIINIVAALGFSDHAYFTRFFKRHEKITPSEYRESHQ